MIQVYGCMMNRRRMEMSNVCDDLIMVFITTFSMWQGRAYNIDAVRIFMENDRGVVARPNSNLYPHIIVPGKNL